MRSLYRVMKNVSRTDKSHDTFEYPEFKEEEEKKPDIPEEKEISSEEEEALAILARSRAEAERILETARNEADRIRKDAYNEGYAEGKDQGYREGFDHGSAEGENIYSEKILELEQQVAACIEDVQIEKDKVLEKYMDDLKEIALAIGEKIVRTSLRSNARVIEKMILAATEKLKKSAWAKIYIGEQTGVGTDVRADPRFLRELGRLSDNVKIIVMEDMEPGTCVVERPEEIIDVSVNTQMENIREIMNNARL